MLLALKQPPYFMIERSRFIEVEGLLAVGCGFLRARVNLDEPPVRSGRNCGKCHRFDESPHTDAVRWIDDDG